MANGPTMTLRGRLTRDPEMAYATSGTAYTRCRMACNRYHGEDQPEDTYFVDITFWGFQAERASGWHRGDMIWVSGDWWKREYTYNGEQRMTEEIRVRDTFFIREAADRTESRAPAEDPGPAVMPDQEPSEDEEEWTD